eukprot:365554-Chlamydomonas_euryale.AAC.27
MEAARDGRRNRLVVSLRAPAQWRTRLASPTLKDFHPIPISGGGASVAARKASRRFRGWASSLVEANLDAWAQKLTQRMRRAFTQNAPKRRVETTPFPASLPAPRL